MYLNFHSCVSWPGRRAVPHAEGAGEAEMLPLADGAMDHEAEDEEDVARVLVDMGRLSDATYAHAEDDLDCDDQLFKCDAEVEHADQLGLQADEEAAVHAGTRLFLQRCRRGTGNSATRAGSPLDHLAGGDGDDDDQLLVADLAEVFTDGAIEEFMNEELRRELLNVDLGDDGD